MITIKEVKTKRDRKRFIRFPLDLYKGCPYFVPPFYIDEWSLFTKKNPYFKTCEYAFFLAEKEGVVVGRIGAILQKASNELRNERRVRFTRFDSIDDQEVANALFAAVEKWTKAKHMDAVCGPLGFSDLDREGLLIEGFDELSTFEEQYNYPYYQKLIENCGYCKEVDWVESKLFVNEHFDSRLLQISKKLIEKYGLRYSNCKSTRELIKRYKDKFFRLLDESYQELYQTVPFTEEMKASILTTFKLAVKIDYVDVIVDKNDDVVCLGISFPSMAKAVQKSNGHLTPAAIVRLLKAIHHPKVIDCGLIGVAPKYARTGVSGALLVRMHELMKSKNIEYAETNLNLEDNTNIRGCWKHFNGVEHKRRRAFIKALQ